MQIIFGNRWRHLIGEGDFWEHVGGIDISLAPSSFGQANTRVTKASDSKERVEEIFLFDSKCISKFRISITRDRVSSLVLRIHLYSMHVNAPPLFCLSLSGYLADYKSKEIIYMCVYSRLKKSYIRTLNVNAFIFCNPKKILLTMLGSMLLFYRLLMCCSRSYKSTSHMEHLLLTCMQELV